MIASGAGKTHVNINLKYQKGQSAPSGNTQIDVGRHKFTSTSHEWLVVSGTTATFRERARERYTPEVRANARCHAPSGSNVTA